MPGGALSMLAPSWLQGCKIVSSDVRGIIYNFYCLREEANYRPVALKLQAIKFEKSFDISVARQQLE